MLSDESEHELLLVLYDRIIGIERIESYFNRSSTSTRSIRIQSDSDQGYIG